MAEVGATSLVPDVPSISKARAGSTDLFDRLWRLLTSVRFAMLLIALIATGVLAGTLVMQAPPDVAASPTSFAGWLARPRAKDGSPRLAVLGALDLYRVFGTLWFRGLLAVLTLSVVVCTVNRMPGIVASVRRPVVRVPERLFERAPLRAEFSYPAASGISAEQAQLQVIKVLGTARFRLIPWEDGAARAVFADRNRFGKYGTFLNHIGIVSILGAAVLGGAFGWREDGFMVPEGSTRAVGHGTSLSVRSEEFVDEYYPSGTAKDFRSDLVLLDDGQEVARKTIRVNDPLDYGGVRFHQAFFGPAAMMQVRNAEGKVVFEDGVALGYELTGGGLSRNGGFFTLGNRNGLPTLAVWVVVPANQRQPDADIPAGSVRLEIFEPRQARPSVMETLPQGETRDLLGHTFEFVRERQFSGLQLSYNPAINLIWFACAAMVLGTIAVFNFPLRRLWVRADEVPNERTGPNEQAAGVTSANVRLRIAAVTNRDVLFAREFEKLALSIDKEVSRLASDNAGTPAHAVPVLAAKA